MRKVEGEGDQEGRQEACDEEGGCKEIHEEVRASESRQEGREKGLRESDRTEGHGETHQSHEAPSELQGIAKEKESPRQGVEGGRQSPGPEKGRAARSPLGDPDQSPPQSCRHRQSREEAGAPGRRRDIDRGPVGRLSHGGSEEGRPEAEQGRRPAQHSDRASLPARALHRRAPVADPAQVDRARRPRQRGPLRPDGCDPGLRRQPGHQVQDVLLDAHPRCDPRPATLPGLGSAPRAPQGQPYRTGAAEAHRRVRPRTHPR